MIYRHIIYANVQTLLILLKSEKQNYDIFGTEYIYNDIYNNIVLNFVF